jgi:hypothetical protein
MQIPAVLTISQNQVQNTSNNINYTFSHNNKGLITLSDPAASKTLVHLHLARYFLDISSNSFLKQKQETGKLKAQRKKRKTRAGGVWDETKRLSKLTCTRFSITIFTLRSGLTLDHSVASLARFQV